MIMTDFSEMFDPSQYKGTTYDPLPIGIYSAQIIEAEITVPQSQDGQNIKLVWQITEGDYANRQVWQHITFAHSNAQAQEIGRRQLKDLCEACGITTSISGPEPFKHIPCKIRVGIKKDKDGVYDDRNVVTRVWPASYEPPASRRPAPQKPVPPKPASPKPQAAWASPAKPSPKSPTASIETAMEGVRFTDQWQPPQTSPKGGTPPQAASQTESNGGTPPQSPSQASSQNSSQAPTQSPAQSPTQAAHGEMPPWRK
jgi:hypothetical protein